MNKKLCVITCALCIGTLTSCKNVASNSENNVLSQQTTTITNTTTSTTEPKKTPTDKTVAAVNPVAIDEENIKHSIETTTASCDYGISADLLTISENATEIIEGTIKNVTYEFIEGNPWIKADILVTGSLKGNLKESDIISVYMLGGYVSLEEHIKYYDDAVKFNVSKKDIKHTMLKTVVENEAFPVIGEESIFYLTETSTASPLPQGAFERVRGKYAQLEIVEKNKTLKRSDPDSNKEKTQKFTWQEVKEKAKISKKN